MVTELKNTNATDEELDLLEKDELLTSDQDLLTDDESPFSEAHVTICEGEQRSGKSTYVVGKTKDAYDKDCVRIFCKNILKIDCEVKAYYRKERVAKIKHEKQIKYIQIPQSYQLRSPMRIFSNIHLYGMPYVYVPNFRVMLQWLENGFISNGYLIMDEAHVGISARNGMSKEGRGFVDQYFQFGKSRLEVFLITHMARLIDWTARTVPTKRVHTTYDPKTRMITYTLRKKGQHGEQTFHFDATQYWGNYRSNEKVNR